MITNHLLFQVAILAIVCQAVEVGDILVCCFSLLMCSPVESRSFKDDVLANLKILMDLVDHFVEFLSVVVADVSRCEDVFCFLTKAV